MLCKQEPLGVWVRLASQVQGGPKESWAVQCTQVQQAVWVPLGSQEQLVQQAMQHIRGAQVL